MKTFISFAILGLLALSGCKKQVVENQLPVTDGRSMSALASSNAPNAEYDSSKQKDTLKGNYTAPLHLGNNKIWYLDGVVSVSNTNITIDAGTIIVGLNPRSTDGKNPGMLLIGGTATITANGTADNPIIFTSKYLVDGNTGTKALPSDFGGLVILGQAPGSMYKPSLYVAKTTADDVVQFAFGGRNPAHSSGQLSFIRLEYAGFDGNTRTVPIGVFYYAGDAFTCFSVGSGTKIDHIECANSKRTSFRFAGGTVDASFLISVDHTTNGFWLSDAYTGMLSYGVSLAGNNQRAGGTGLAVTPKWSTELVSTDPPGTTRIDHFTIAGIDKDRSTYVNLSAAIYHRQPDIPFELTNSILMGYDYAFTDIYYYKRSQSLKATGNIFCNTLFKPDVVTSVPWLCADGKNKRYTNAVNSNGFTRIRQPFLRLGDVNLVPLSVSPANEGTTNQAGAFNDYSRPVSKWANTQNWYKLYY